MAKEELTGAEARRQARIEESKRRLEEMHQRADTRQAKKDQGKKDQGKKK